MMPVMSHELTGACRILWVEDDPKDLRGHVAYIEYLGHEVVSVRTAEDLIAAVQSERFDLLMVDESLPQDKSGGKLMIALHHGELGELNRNTPFVFVTASSDWVDDEAVDLPGCMGIAEKGGEEISEWIEENLPNANEQDTPPEPPLTSGAAHSAGGPRAQETELRYERWLGLVLDVGEDRFRARLTDADGLLPDHEVTFPLDILNADALEDREPGAEFEWSVRLVADNAGRRTVSQLALSPEVEFTHEEVERALDRVRKRRRDVDDRAE